MTASVYGSTRMQCPSIRRSRRESNYDSYRPGFQHEQASGHLTRRLLAARRYCRRRPKKHDSNNILACPSSPQPLSLFMHLARPLESCKHLKNPVHRWNITMSRNIFWQYRLEMERISYAENLPVVSGLRSLPSLSRMILTDKNSL